MNWLTFKNCEPLDFQLIPIAGFTEFHEQIIIKIKSGLRPISFFALGNKLYIVLADDEKQNLYTASTIIKESKYESLTPSVPCMYLLERLLYEKSNLLPENHPWLKPVRKIQDYSFYKMEGEEIHEVAVGPVHAGIIEPGHFRFMCHGEKVHHLEIQLGYQHRGIEDLFLKGSFWQKHTLSESIAGDTLIAHNFAYCQLVESLTTTKIPQRALYIRTIALELERIAMHLADLSAISGDIAYQMGNAVFSVTRTLVINSLQAISGNRFGKGLLRAGGVNFNINQELVKELTITLNKVKHDVMLMGETMFAAPDVLSRLEYTGILTTEKAKEIGMVGLAARASGLARDIRFDHPFGIFPLELPEFTKLTMNKGDVFSRTYLRYQEILQSIAMISNLLNKLGALPQQIKTDVCNKVPKKCFAVSMVEGWRGEIVHLAITDNEGFLQKYEIKDPSFNNWFALAKAVRGNGISDFPLCNKSFNLSYCGHDL